MLRINKAVFLPDNPALLLHCAVTSGSIKCTQYLLDSGIPVDLTSPSTWLGSYWTALEVAACQNQPHCCELLIKRGANIHYKDPGSFQAIHRASSSGSTQCLKVLIDHSADVNAYNEDGVSPLHIAIEHGYDDCVKLLLAHGANPRAPNCIFYHLLPLPIAIVFNQFEIARLLLEHDPTLINCAYTHKYGREFDIGDKTPLQLVAAWGEDKWLLFLLNYQPDHDLISLAGKTALDYAKENGHGHCVSLLYDYMIEREFTMSSIVL